MIACSIGLLGLVGAGTESGSWYFERRHGQNAADAAAVAGVLQVVSDLGANVTPGTDVTTAATSNATANGYTAGTASGTTTAVSVTSGNYSTATGYTSGGTPLNAVQTTIARTSPLLFSSLVLAKAPSIGETAVAAFIPNGGNACTLALSAGLGFQGSTTVTAINCVQASNEGGSSSINFTGSAASASGALTAVGGCSGTASQCGASGDSFYAPPTINPYTAVNTQTFPSPTSATCQNMPTSGTVPASATYEHSSRMFCTGTFSGTKYTGDINKTSLNLSPGTYVLYNAGITLSGGDSLTCTSCVPGTSGVTIIFTGPSAGTITMSGHATLGASVNNPLNAPPPSQSPLAFGGAFAGILFYQDYNSPENDIKVTGNPTLSVAGGIYFPQSSFTVTGNMSSTANCTSIVAKQIQFSGNSSVAVSGCGTVGTATAKTQYVALVQ